jgi:hypothetical protein
MSDQARGRWNRERLGERKRVAPNPEERDVEDEKWRIRGVARLDRLPPPGGRRRWNGLPTHSLWNLWCAPAGTYFRRPRVPFDPPRPPCKIPTSIRDSVCTLLRVICKHDDQRKFCWSYVPCVGPTLFLIFGVRERTAAGLETVISVALCRWHHTADETRPGKFTARGYLVVACLQLNPVSFTF